MIIVLAIVAIICVMVTALGLIVCGNQWYTEEGVLRKIRMMEPNTDTLTSERRVFAYSRITTRDKSGVIRDYELDSNVLFNYRLKPLPFR